MLEDSDADVEMIQRQLAKAGLDYECKVMMTREAYEPALREFKPDIILSDNAMPQFSASEALQILQQHNIHIPFLLVTGTVSEEFAAGIIKAGADDYLLKDRLTRLPAAIETALKQKQTEREKKKAEQKLIKANRLYFFISQLNQMIVRTTNEKKLFEEVCNIAVEVGKFKMAWIGMIDWQTKKVIPVMHAGEEREYLTRINPISIDDIPEGNGPTGTALRMDKYIVCNDIENDPAMSPWREAASGMQYRSSISVPVKKFGQVIGTFNVYASEKNFFDEAEIALIEEATGDISFALEVFEKETLRKNAENTLKISEEKYISLVNTVDGIVWEADATTFEFTFVSKQAERLLGYTTEQWLHTPSFWGSHIYTEDRDWAIEFCKNNTLAKKAHEFEYRMVAADGHIVWLRDIVSVIMENDSPLILRGIMIDITERKKAEEAIIESEKRYQTLAEISPVGIFHTDAEGITTYVNPKWCEISGLTSQEALGNGWLRAVHEDDKEALINGWQNATSSVRASLSEYRFVRPDGSVAWVIGEAIPEKNSDQQIVGYVGTITDITERKIAEKQIFKEKELSDKIINSLPGIFYLSDDTPKLLRWNKALEKISGFTEKEIDARRPITLFEPDDHAILQQGMAKSYHEGAAEVEVRLLTKTGERIPFYFTGISIEYGGKPAVLGIGIDITQLKKAEEEIKKSNERFELIAKATQDGLWDWNLETDKLWGNEVHQQLYGLTLADPVPNHEDWKKRIHPDDRERTIEAFEETKASDQNSYIDEYRFYTESEGWMNIYGRTLIQRNKEGRPVRLIGSMMNITERKRTEELLAASEKRFRKLVENGNDAFAILSPEGKAIYISSSVQRVLGYTEEEMYQMDMFSLVHPANIEEVQKTLHTVMANPGVPVAGHISRLKHKDGSWRWFEDTITNLTDDPDVGGIVDNFRDITERINSQAALQQSEEKYRDIVENITDILCTHDMEGRVLSVNLTAKKQLGYEIEDMLKMNIRDILLPRSKQGFDSYISSLKQNGFAQGLMYIKTSTGQSRVWEFRNTLRNNGINPPFVYGFAQDVTERIQAEEKLLEQKMQLETLSNNLPGVMIYQAIRQLDGAMKFTYISDGVIGLIGKTPAEVIADPSLLYKPIVQEDIHKLIQAEQQSFLNMSLFQEEVRLKTDKGDIRWLNIVSVPRKLNDGRTVWDGFHVDVTDRKRKEEEVRSSEEKRRFIMNSALDAIVCMDTDGMITFWNPQAEKIFGWHEDEVMGKKLSEIIIPPQFRNMHEAGIKKYLITGEAPVLNTLLELNAINRQQEEFPVELTVLPIKQGGEEFFCSFIRDITQRKKAAEAIKESEEKYRTLVEQASDGIFIADNTGKFIITNSSACKLSGYTAAELKELTIYDLVHPESFAARPFQFEEMMKPQGARSERKMICKDGTVLDVEVSAKFLSDKRFIAFIRDIGDRLKAAAAIRESEEKYRSLVEQASDGIFISDRDGRFITVNPSACKISQYTEEELLQMSIFDFFIEEDIKQKPIQFEALNQGKTIISERKMKRKDGGVNHLEITAKLLNDGKLLSFVRDISERIKAQNEIIKEKTLSDSIINSLPGIFYLYNRQGKFLRWNTNFEKVSLFSAAEIRQMHPLNFYDGDEKKIIAQKIDNVFTNGEDEVQVDFMLKTKEKIPYYFTGVAVDYEGERCLMGVGIDFSERKRAQEEIEKTTGKLRELTAHLLNIREEERKRIGREIHDELGQQLTAIKMDVSWIDKKIPDATELIKNKLKNIITLLDGSNQSIRRILSELRPGILDDYGLIEALEWQNRQFTANTGIPVEFVTAERELKLPEPIATCIFRVYQEAFTNITRHADASKVATSLAIINSNITVSIADNGKGFAAALTQEKKSFGILGMKERVLAQGGSFEVVSIPGKGTKLLICLPFTSNKNILN